MGWRRYCSTLGMLVCLAGCGDGRPERVPVSGQVLIDGEPVTSGSVRFSPEEGRVSIGRLDDQGRFRLTCYESGDGAIVGKHRVAVISREVIGDTKVKIKYLVPRKYSNYATSGITEVITEPTDSLTINLTWGNGGPD